MMEQTEGRYEDKALWKRIYNKVLWTLWFQFREGPEHGDIQRDWRL